MALSVAPSSIPVVAPRRSSAFAPTTDSHIKHPAFYQRPISLQLQSPLLSLPAELRNAIYQHLLHSQTASSSRITSRTHPPYSSNPSPPSDVHTAILRTCRQIHHEATPILYSSANVFTAHPTLLSRLPHLLDPSRPVLMSSCADRISRWRVFVRLDTDARFGRAEARNAFDGCEELTVVAWQAQFGSSDYSALDAFLGVRGVRKARVKGTSDGFARWLEGLMMRSIMKGGKGGKGKASVKREMQRQAWLELAAAGAREGRCCGGTEEEELGPDLDGEDEDQIQPYVLENGEATWESGGGESGYDLWTHGGR